MKKLIAAICFMALAAPGVFAQEKGRSAEKNARPAAQKMAQAAKKEPSAAQKKQRQKMKDCNKQAGTTKLEGGERKKFMSSCLKG